MANNTIIGSSPEGITTAEWSTKGAEQTWGAVLSIRNLKTGERETVPTADGDTKGVYFYDERDELEIEVAHKSGFSLPAIGDTVTIYGLTGYVLSAEKSGAYRQWRKAKITATKWTAMGGGS